MKDRLDYQRCQELWNAAPGRKRQYHLRRITPTVSIRRNEDESFHVEFRDRLLLMFNPNGLGIVRRGGPTGIVGDRRFLCRYGPGRVRTRYYPAGRYGAVFATTDWWLEMPADHRILDECVTLPVWAVRPQWLTTDVVALARVCLKADLQGEHHPIGPLTDALQDAGCDSPGLLGALRGTFDLLCNFKHCHRAVLELANLPPEPQEE
jgi:hypothetical protein